MPAYDPKRTFGIRVKWGVSNVRPAPLIRWVKIVINYLVGWILK